MTEQKKKLRPKPHLDYDKTLSMLQSKPDVWFELARGDYGPCSAVASAMKRRGCLAATKNDDGVYTVLACWPVWDEDYAILKPF